MEQKIVGFEHFDALKERTKGYLWVAVFVAVGLMAASTLAGAGQGSELSRVVGLSAVGGISSFMVLGLLGILFGVPRANVGAPGDRPYLANTSLEQVSDWATKILIGIGIGQFRSIADGVGKLGRLVAGGFRGQDVGNLIAIAMMVGCGVCGFFFFYVWTRVYFPILLTWSDNRNDLAGGTGDGAPVTEETPLERSND